VDVAVRGRAGVGGDDRLEHRRRLLRGERAAATAAAVEAELHAGDGGEVAVLGEDLGQPAVELLEVAAVLDVVAAAAIADVALAAEPAVDGAPAAAGDDAELDGRVIGEHGREGSCRSGKDGGHARRRSRGGRRRPARSPVAGVASALRGSGSSPWAHGRPARRVACRS
jgi:hypothetical protein